MGVFTPLGTNEREKRDSHYSQVTQETVNLLPMWHKGRRLRTSNYQQVLNAMVGTQLERMETVNDQLFLDSYLVFVDTDAPDILLKYQIKANTEFYDTFEAKNLIVNGDFKVRSNPSLIADRWNYTGDVIYGEGLISNVCATFDNEVGSGGSVYQEVFIELPAGTPLCSSAYYLVPTWTTTGNSTNDNHALQMEVYYKDGTTETVTTQFALTTGGYWMRAYASTTTDRQCFKIVVTGKSTKSATFTINQPVLVDAFMLEYSTKPSQWEPSRLDYPHYLSVTQFPLVAFRAEHPVYLAENLENFWFNAMPTRALAVSSRSSTISAVTGVGSVSLVDYFGETWDAEFQHTGTHIQKVGVTCDGEVYGTYELAFINARDRYQVGQTYTIKALAWFHDMVWAVVQKDVLGTSMLLLCVIDPKVPSPEPDYLEVVASVELSGIPTDIDRAEFRYNDQQYIYLSDGVTEYAVRLYYDYFMFDVDSFMAYFREEYDELVLQNDVRYSTV